MANPTRKYLAGAGELKEVGYNHLMSNKREWNNCFIKNPSKLWKSRLKWKKKRPIFVGHGIINN